MGRNGKTHLVAVSLQQIADRPEYRNKRRLIESAENNLFLPILIEKAFFERIKDHPVFNRLREQCSQLSNIQL